MSKQNAKKPSKLADLPATDLAADVKGGADGLGLLAQVSHIQSQGASSSVKQVAAKQRAMIK